jgi:hypothetical protein
MQGSACCLLHGGFLFGLFFDREDGGDMCLRNFGGFSMEYMGFYPK